VGFVFKNNSVLLTYNAKYSMWLGFGGHLREGDVPDERLVQKFKQEAGLDIEILNPTGEKIPELNNTVRNCGIPFHADIHNVGDHNHYGQYYACIVKDPNQEVSISPDEKDLLKYRWLTKEQLLVDKEVFESTKEMIKVGFSIYNEAGSGADIK